MSFAMLMTITVVEILALVVVLAIFLVLLTRRLRSIANSLSKVAWGVRAVETEVSAIAAPVIEVNGLLRELTEVLLPGVAAKAEQVAVG